LEKKPFCICDLLQRSKESKLGLLNDLLNLIQVRSKYTKSLIFLKIMNRLLVACMEISFEDFMKLEIHVGKVEEATLISGSRNLIKLIVDFGFEKRQSVAGLLKYYEPEELVGKKFVFVLNLQRKKLMGVESQCMALAAEDDDGNVVLICPEKDIMLGSKVG
jgi:methionine--tRNA ligase beta chain